MKSILLFGSSILAALPSVAAAQGVEAQVNQNSPTAATPRVSQPGDIVVTALRRSETLQRVPAAITAVGGGALQASGINSAEALANNVPSLQFSTQVNSMRLAIRGISIDATNGGAGEPAIAPYVNGVYIARVTSPLIDFTDLARIEVLRGPQGTLYGRNSTGGAVNFIARGPADEFEGSVQIGTGSYNRKLVRATVAGPAGVLGYRVSGSFEENDGAVRNLTTGHRIGALKRYYLHGSLGFNPDDSDIENKLDLFYVEEHTEPLQLLVKLANPNFFQNNFPTRQVRTINDQRKIYINTPNQTKRDMFLATNNLTVPLSEKIALKSITGYIHHKLRGLQDNDGTDQSITTLGTILPTIDFGLQRLTSREFTQEFNLSGDVGPVTFVGGVYYYRERNTPSQPAQFPIGLPSSRLPAGTTIVQFANDLTRSKAAFADVTLHITDRLRAVGGLRVSEDRKTIVQNQGLFVPGVNAPLSCVDRVTKLKFKSTTPKLGVQFDAAPDVLTYAQYQKGQKAGTYNLSSCADTAGPEKVTSYEVGVKSRLAPGVTLNVTGFYYDYTDLQVQVTRVIEGITSFGLQNAATAKVKGVEVEASISAIPRLNISAGISYLDTKYLQYTNIVAGVLQDFSGNRLNRAPKWQIKPSVDYTLPLTGFFSELSLHGDANYTSRVFFDPRNRLDISQPGVILFNASMNLVSESNGLTLRAFGRNLTNRDVFTSLVDSPTQGGIFGYRGLPRTWGLELEKSF